MSKSVVMVLSKYDVNSCWMCGDIAFQKCLLIVI